MPRDEQDQNQQGPEDTLANTELDAEDELDDEDLEKVAGGWSGEGDGSGGGG